jgi:hypothetical protein
VCFYVADSGPYCIWSKCNNTLADFVTLYWKLSQLTDARSDPSPGGVAQLVERVLYHSTRGAVPERSWVQSLLPTTEVEPGFSTFGGMLVPVLQLISPVCKTRTTDARSLWWH